MNKKLVIYLCAILALCSCSKKDDDLKSDNKPKEPIIIEAKSIKFCKDVLELNPGYKEKLSYTILPENTTNKDVEWKVSDPKIASVCPMGGVSAKAIGECIISVETSNGLKAECKLIVKKRVIPITGIAFPDGKPVLEVGKVERMPLLFTPENTTQREVKFKSSDENILTVEDSGLVTGISPGVAEVTVTTVNGNFSAKAKIEIIEVYHVRKVYITKDCLELKIGESETLRAIVTPRYATNKNVIWKSSNTKIAKVDQDGKVVALAKGKADIIITSEDDKDKTYTCELTVVD